METINVYHHFGIPSAGYASGEAILCLLEKIMATQQELAAQVTAANGKLTKIGAETGTLLAKIEELKQAIANAPTVTPELQAAVDALSAQAQIVDDLVPDVTT